jgi:hypothetical protein
MGGDLGGQHRALVYLAGLHRGAGDHEWHVPVIGSGAAVLGDLADPAGVDDTVLGDPHQVRGVAVTGGRAEQGVGLGACGDAG